MSVKFRYTDAAILYCVLDSGCDLNHLVERYTCFERVAVPSYKVMAGCLSRAIRAGAVLHPQGGLYRLSDEWLKKAHIGDGKSNSTDALIEFAEKIVNREWPDVCEAEFVLPTSEYQRAAEHTRQYLTRLFEPY